MHIIGILYFIANLLFGSFIFWNINTYSIDTKMTEINDIKEYIISMHLMLSVESYEDLNKQTNLIIKINSRVIIVKKDIKKVLYFKGIIMK